MTTNRTKTRGRAQKRTSKPRTTHVPTNGAIALVEAEMLQSGVRASIDTLLDNGADGPLGHQSLLVALQMLRQVERAMWRILDRANNEAFAAKHGVAT
jgi:hypothetical protein